MADVQTLLDRLAQAAVEHRKPDVDDFDGPANLAAAQSELRRRRPNKPDQLAEHRRLHREAKRHVEFVDKHNAENPQKPM